MKRYVRQPYKIKTYHIKDLDCDMVVEETTRKELFSYLDEYLENVQYDWFDGRDFNFCILYTNGATDTINEEYDGHPVKRINIASIVMTNPEDDIVFGPYEINYYGVVTPSFSMQIDDNIELVGEK